MEEFPNLITEEHFKVIRFGQLFNFQEQKSYPKLQIRINTYIINVTQDTNKVNQKWK